MEMPNLGPGSERAGRMQPSAQPALPTVSGIGRWVWGVLDSEGFQLVTLADLLGVC